MSVAALIFSALLLGFAASLRAGGASLVRTPRADALHDAADGSIRAERVAGLLEDRPVLQPALGMVHSAVLVAAAVPAAWAITSLSSGLVTPIGLIVLGLILVLLGDLLPREAGRRKPRVIAYRFSRFLAWAVAVGIRAADLIEDDEDDQAEAEESAQDQEEMELISSVIHFTDIVVREVMVPRPDMFVISADAAVTDALKLVIQEGRSRIPVTGEGIDDIVGILYAKDMLTRVTGSPPTLVRSMMRDAYFVPETKRVPELLKEMQGNRAHMAIVVDEFGGTAGLVTIEDILEELVGEIVDEYDVEEPLVTALDQGGYLVDGRLNLTELEGLIEADLPDEELDTVGGLLLSLAGRVPHQGEEFEYGSFLLTAERIQGRRVAQVRISPQ